MTIKDEYRNIRRKWQDGLSYGDLYALIITWISKYKMIIRSSSLLHLIDRLCTDDIYKIVDDFINGDVYADLRNEML